MHRQAGISARRPALILTHVPSCRGYGEEWLRDASGSYREPLLIAAALDMVAAVVILRGRWIEASVS